MFYPIRYLPFSLQTVELKDGVVCSHSIWCVFRVRIHAKGVVVMYTVNNAVVGYMARPSKTLLAYAILLALSNNDVGVGIYSSDNHVSLFWLS